MPKFKLLIVIIFIFNSLSAFGNEVITKKELRRLNDLYKSLSNACDVIQAEGSSAGYDLRVAKDGINNAKSDPKGTMISVGAEDEKTFNEYVRRLTAMKEVLERKFTADDSGKKAKDACSVISYPTAILMQQAYDIFNHNYNVPHVSLECLKTADESCQNFKGIFKKDLDQKTEELKNKGNPAINEQTQLPSVKSEPSTGDSLLKKVIVPVAN